MVRRLPMNTRVVLLTAVLAACGLATSAQSPPVLTVQRGGPTGEIAELDDANEIRIVFSEPMVALGRIPQPVTAPFVRIQPALTGTFRWSGTTILIFTPDPKQPLPYATRYQVTVDTAARAVSGRQLAAPYTFAFTTPTVRLLVADHHRLEGRADRPVVFMLRFNQPVQPAAVLPHLTARLEPHTWDRPALTTAAEQRLGRLDPAGLKQFRAKVAAADAVARSSAAVPLRLASNWDRVAYPPSPDLVVVEAPATVQPESWVRLAIDGTVPSVQGPATPGGEQVQIERLAPA